LGMKTINDCELEVVKLRQKILSMESSMNKKLERRMKKYKEQLMEKPQYVRPLLVENARLKDEVEQLRNFLYVLTRHPSELEHIRQAVDNLQN